MFFFSFSACTTKKKKKFPREFLFHIFYIIYHFLIIPGRCRAHNPLILQPAFAIGAREFLLLFFFIFFFTCKTILFTPRLHKLHFYVSFFILRLFFSSFFHSRILCEMGKNTLLLCKETLNVSLCFFHSLCRSYFSE